MNLINQKAQSIRNVSQQSPRRQPRWRASLERPLRQEVHPPTIDDTPATGKAKVVLAANGKDTAALKNQNLHPRAKASTGTKSPQGTVSRRILSHPTLPTGQHSAIARQSATDLQNALQQAHRERQGHLLAPVGKMAPLNSSPSRLVTRTTLPPSLQNGASCWGPRIGIIHLSAKRCRAGMSGSVNQSEEGTLVPHFG